MLTVNNAAIDDLMAPETPMLWALRDAFNLTGARYGRHGVCGACTVYMDGQAVRACQVRLATAEGSFVTTTQRRAGARTARSR